MIKIDFNPPEKQLRQFGVVSLFAFPAFGWLVLHLMHGSSTTPAWWCTGIGVVVFAASVVKPRLILPVFVGLMLLAFPIGLVLSTVALALIYYLMFTPLGLFFRLIGRDKLHKGIDPSATSYWVERRGDVPLARYLRMY